MSTRDLYRSHLGRLDKDLARAVEHANHQGVATSGALFHAGRTETYHADDKEIPFEPTPHFRRWAPLTGPEHLVLARPGRRPRVVEIRPRDFWHECTPSPHSYWQGEVDHALAGSFDEAADILGPVAGIAYVGSSPAAAASLGIPTERIEPPPLMAVLDWCRATKTEHEVALTEAAAAKAAAGHLEARQLFEAGASEREIHHGYLQACDHLELEVPYGTIVALDDKAGILHYQHKRGREAASGSVLLLDAGAAVDGYAIDITRTWTRSSAHEIFQELVRQMDVVEQKLVSQVVAGRPFLELHIETHREVGRLLTAAGVFRISGEEAFERGLTRTFLPHGLGHHLGLQVHDVGGHQAGPEGGEIPPPAEYPWLRNTRILEPGHLVTIEPGLYFIPMLLDQLKAGEHADAVSWSLVDELLPCGGVRIEDNVLCTEGAPRDLTRPLLPGPSSD